MSNDTNAPPENRTAKKDEPKLAIVSRLASSDKADLKDCLMDLLARAIKGEIVGLAFIVEKEDFTLLADTAGTASAAPAKAIGMAALLKDALIGRMRLRPVDE